MSKHTPGPYRINAIGDRLFLKGPKDKTLAEVNRTFGGRDLPADANAALLAAAPEMLAACEALQAALELHFSLTFASKLTFENALAMTTSAIAKAKGEVTP